MSAQAQCQPHRRSRRLMEASLKAAALEHLPTLPDIISAMIPTLQAARISRIGDLGNRFTNKDVVDEWVAMCIAGATPGGLEKFNTQFKEMQDAVHAAGWAAGQAAAKEAMAAC